MKYIRLTLRESFQIAQISYYTEIVYYTAILQQAINKLIILSATVPLGSPGVFDPLVQIRMLEVLFSCS